MNKLLRRYFPSPVKVVAKPIMLVIIVIPILLSCVTYHQYRSDPSEIILEHGKILIFAGPAAFESETSKLEIDVDSSGTLWYVGLDYYPKKGMSGCEFNLIADSMILKIDSLHYIKNIPDSLRYEVHCHQFSADLTVLGIRLPKNKFISQFELTFNLIISNSKTGTLIEKRPILLQLNYRKDKEFYWGK